MDNIDENNLTDLAHSFKIVQKNERIACEKPGKDIIEPSIKYKPPEQNTENYVVSKVVCDTLKVFPKTETIYNNIERKFIEALIDYEHISNTWNEKLKELEASNKKNEEKVKMIINEQRKLWKTHIDFEELIVSNVYKTERCQRVLKESDSILKNKQSVLEKLKNRIEKFKRARESLEVDVAKYKIYADFLESFLTIEPKYKNINNIVKRYDELSKTRKAIAREQGKIILSLDDLRLERSNSLELKRSKLMDFENKIIKLEERYNYARKVTFYWEKMLYHAKSGYLTRMLEIERATQCGYNIYQDICYRTGNPVKISIKEKINLFKYLKNVLEFYENVCKIATELHERELSSGYVEIEKEIIEDAPTLLNVLGNEKTTDKSSTDLLNTSQIETSSI